MYQQLGIFPSSSGVVTDVGVLLVIGGLALHAAAGTERPFGVLGRRAAFPLASVALFFGWQLVTSFWSSAPEAVILSAFQTYVEAPFLLVLALLTFKDRASVRLGMFAYLLAGIILIVYATRNYGFVKTISTLPLTTGQAEQTYRGGLNVAYNVNELSAVLSVVPAMAYLALEPVRPVLRYAVTLLSLPFVALALVILTSRGTLIGLGAGVVLALLLARGGLGRVAVALVAGAGVAVGFILSATGNIPYYFSRRFQAIGTDQFGGRGPVWQLAWSLFQRHPLGLGLASFETLVPSASVTLYAGVSASHSDYIGTLVNSGLVGFFLLLVMLFALGREIVFRGGDRNPAIVVVFTVLVVGMGNGNYVVTPWFWVIVGLVLCYGLTRENERGGSLRPVMSRANP